jgi:hypothetical protein
MAGLASINLYRLMFENERPLLVRMTLEADRILRRGSPHLFGFHRSVYIVAIAALDQSLIHPVMERHVELRFLLEVAAVAKLGLGLHEQELRFCGVVWRVAGDATDIVLGVHRVDGVPVLRAAGMAGEAAFVDLLGRVILKDKNLGDVSAASDVRRSGPVAALASLVRWAVFGIEGGLPVRTLLPAVVNVLVASLADFCSYIFRRRRRVGRRILRSVLFLVCRAGWFFLGLSPNGRGKQDERE